VDAVVPVGSWSRRIVITGLHASAHIGWTADERASPQLLVLDLVLDLVSGDRVSGNRVLGDRVLGDRVAEERVAGNLVSGDRVSGNLVSGALSAPIDDLAGTVDYAELSARVAELVAHSSRRLLEALAGDVLTEVLRDRRVDAATVTVHKPGAPMSVEVDDVAVVVSGRS
jgi:dihydroneopterin aldolase